MRLRFMLLLAVVVLLLSTFPFPSVGIAGEVGAGVYTAPPAYAFSAPPVVVPVPGTCCAYYDPDVTVEIFFYHGFWWRPWESRWYRARYYDGPWFYIARPPRLLMALPPNYRGIQPGHRRILYPDLSRNWRMWERERYWDRHWEWPGMGPGGHGGMGRGGHGGMGMGRH